MPYGWNMCKTRVDTLATETVSLELMLLYSMCKTRVDALVTETVIPELMLLGELLLLDSETRNRT
jgi:hypothetical protein